MAAIDQRAAALNAKLAKDDEDDLDPDQGEVDPEDEADEDQGDEEDEAEPAPAAAAAPAQASAGSGSASGLILGLLAYSVVVQYLRGGSAQVRGWLKAKALNIPYAAPASSSMGPGGKGQSQGTA